MERDEAIQPEEGKEIRVYKIEEGEWLEMAIEIASHYLQQANDVQELIHKAQMAQNLGLLVDFLITEEGSITLKIGKKPKLGFIP